MELDKGENRRGMSSANSGPVHDKQEELVTEEDAMKRIWANHFGDLAKDYTGNSRDPTKWNIMNFVHQADVKATGSQTKLEAGTGIGGTDLTVSTSGIRNGKEDIRQRRNSNEVEHQYCSTGAQKGGPHRPK
ncbi:hypothetical protein AX774_g2289 [Zancudomyces culisetae]|uniref:Uncharacterized protein n=1 Tax=Zancudomyces culisetae TaxID=1213189 RepID=A0A1R1PTA4_ZANCU|nr:hypothetical protein AX774_g2289 [Zancudomyces culisetae]|eukprot:OMH84198.1 hypothetical protein AX774_g2289 [Zancudomyces culisetae]